MASIKPIEPLYAKVIFEVSRMVLISTETLYHLSSVDLCYTKRRWINKCCQTGISQKTTKSGVLIFSGRLIMISEAYLLESNTNSDSAVVWYAI